MELGSAYLQCWLQPHSVTVSACELLIVVDSAFLQVPLCLELAVAGGYPVKEQTEAKKASVGHTHHLWYHSGEESFLTQSWWCVWLVSAFLQKVLQTHSVSVAAGELKLGVNSAFLQEPL